MLKGQKKRIRKKQKERINAKERENKGDKNKALEAIFRDSWKGDNFDHQQQRNNWHISTRRKKRKELEKEQEDKREEKQEERTREKENEDNMDNLIKCMNEEREKKIMKGRKYTK